MRRRRVIIGILAVVLCGVLAVVFWPEESEPVYKGKKLSQWVVEIAQTDASGEWRRGSEACHAIETIGTNGIPFYLRWMTFRPSFLRKTLYWLADKSRRWVDFHFSPGNDEKSRPSCRGRFRT